MSTERHHDFQHAADALLRRVLARLDTFDPDELEADLASGVLRITFADRKNCILNRQSAANQIWLAEGASAWHFAQEQTSGRWLDTKGRGDVDTILAEILSRRLGRPISL
ncbi:MAG: iron donor protein CyaY [Planctomycetes bacterium]|nr:iron donor protein CyaY [Planctomycetota bacterium]